MSNTTIADLINAIDLDPNATEREKYLVTEYENFMEETKAEQSTVDDLEIKVSELETENTGLTEKIDELESSIDALNEFQATAEALIAAAKAMP